MDVYTIIIRDYYEALLGLGISPKVAQRLAAELEVKHRRSFGGAIHHFSRVQQVPVKARIVELGAAGLGPRQIAERVGVSRQYVYQVLSAVRPDGCQQDDPGN